jgi:hypothetical protein
LYQPADELLAMVQPSPRGPAMDVHLPRGQAASASFESKDAAVDSRHFLFESAVCVVDALLKSDVAFGNDPDVALDALGYSIELLPGLRRFLPEFLPRCEDPQVVLRGQGWQNLLDPRESKIDISDKVLEFHVVHPWLILPDRVGFPAVRASALRS